MKKGFPENFLWGAATASAQIEGGYNEGGRSPSIWDVAPERKIKNGENCHTACDHFHHYKEDVAIMKQLGFKSYRFSVSWSRIIPEEGKVNSNGLAFYSNLVDELLQNGIEPLVTLYHWDLPLWVDKYGGWESKKIVAFFQEYVKTVVDALSDRVTYWMTFNEPSCFMMNGYMQGVHAPFKRHYLSLPKFSKIFMKANFEAVKTIRAHAKKKPLVGLSYAAGANIPKSQNSTDIEKARNKTFFKGIGVMNNRWWMDPIILGKGVRAYGIYHISNRFARRIKVDFDFMGINNYEAFDYAAWGGDKSIDKSKFKKSSMGWVIDGRSIYWTLKFIYERYRLPIMVTENGMAWNDKVVNGEVDDNIRIEFMDEYIGNVKKAIADGVPVIGYQHWSLLDNFEWAEGYEPRFGLVHVDFATQKRTIKNSAYHYGEIIKTNGENLL